MSPRSWPAGRSCRRSAAGSEPGGPRVQPTSLAFKANTERALGDRVLQAALGLARGGFQHKRRAAADRLPEFEALRDAAKAIKDHTLAHLDLYLEAFERRVLEQGGK